MDTSFWVAVGLTYLEFLEEREDVLFYFFLWAGADGVLFWALRVILQR